MLHKRQLLLFVNFLKSYRSRSATFSHVGYVRSDGRTTRKHAFSAIFQMGEGLNKIYTVRQKKGTAFLL